MDPLLDLVRAMRLTGGVFLEAEFTSPWCIATRVTPDEYGAFLPRPSHVIAYHCITEGRCLVEVDGHSRVEVHAGEVVILTRNQTHRLGSAPGLPAISSDQLIWPAAAGALARLVHGGGGERTRMVCGFLGTDAPGVPVANLLPPILTVGLQPGAAGAWIESSLRFAAEELIEGRVGSPVVLARLAELLFIEAVRRHVEGHAGDRGWLAGLRDPIVGRALALLHGQPPQRWTVASLAREVGASRSVLADRFTALIGESPMRYFARQRLRAAADRIRQSSESVAGIGFDAGYDSEAAFSRAFKREFGRSPAAWRKGASDRPVPHD